jgi:hypothetical protein
MLMDCMNSMIAVTSSLAHTHTEAEEGAVDLITAQDLYALSKYTFTFISLN